FRCSPRGLGDDSLECSWSTEVSSMLRNLWNDDCGIIVKVELIFVITILVIGCLTSLVALRQAVISEAVETANAIMSLNQSFSFSGQSTCESSTAGSAASDSSCGRITEGSTAAVACPVDQSPCD